MWWLRPNPSLRLTYSAALAFIVQTGMFSRSLIFATYNQPWQHLNQSLGPSSRASSMDSHDDDDGVQGSSGPLSSSSSPFFTELRSWQGTGPATETAKDDSVGSWKEPHHLRMRLTDEV